MGPLIRESDAIRAADWVQEAVRGGARLLCGGNRKGSLLEPTVLTGTKPDHESKLPGNFRAGRDGRALLTISLRRSASEINNSPYGLQAGLFARDAKLIFQAYEELEVGGLIAGDVPTFRIDHMPYGGVKDSGLGREGLRDAIQEMTEPKLLVMNFADDVAGDLLAPASERSSTAVISTTSTEIWTRLTSLPWTIVSLSAMTLVTPPPTWALTAVPAKSPAASACTASVIVFMARKSSVLR